jgi:hypothetical protein
MYILYESLPSNDPRTQAVDRYNYYLFYDVGYVDPLKLSQVNLSLLNAVEIPEEVAKASRFAQVNMLAYDGGIKFRVADGGVGDLFLDTSLNDDDPRKKVIYTLTDDDQKNTLEFLKALMTLEVQNHYRQLTDVERARYPNKKALILIEISKCESILDAHRLLHCRFGTEVHNHQRDAEELGSPEWDLSTPGLEIRNGTRRVVDRPTITEE